MIIFTRRFRSLLVLLVTLSSVFAMAGAAQANEMTDFARKWFPVPECQNGVAVQYTEPAELAKMTGNEGSTGVLGAAFVDDAKKGKCVVYIRSGLKPYLECSVIVHEIGHLAGREHTEPNLKDAMAPAMQWFPGCVTRYATDADLVEYIKEQWDVRRCVLRKRRGSKAVFRCLERKEPVNVYIQEWGDTWMQYLRSL